MRGWVAGIQNCQWNIGPPGVQAVTTCKISVKFSAEICVTLGTWYRRASGLCVCVCISVFMYGWNTFIVVCLPLPFPGWASFGLSGLNARSLTPKPGYKDQTIQKQIWENGSVNNPITREAEICSSLGLAG